MPAGLTTIPMSATANQLPPADVADARTDVAEPPTPLLRGVLHLAVAVFAPVGLVLLILIADSPRRYVAAAIFATSLILLYATSASYHIVPWPGRRSDIMARVDHSMVFVLIAGTYTPFCLVTMGYAWGIPMLSVVWSLAAAGVFLAIAWPRAPRWLDVGLCLGLGWIGVIAATQLWSNLAGPPFAMLLAGGVLYSIGAIVYATRRPDPFPRVFGFHEVFHIFVVAGSLLHFTVIAAYVIN